ncbi:MAG TPA: lipocalin family protein [Steroidobacteraceae bacterium]|nr:lipocalin family protein [Steroidobacteraceae bacterium]HQR48318.1 lipocalin family protein [Steroidobacteraceae bacterium]
MSHAKILAAVAVLAIPLAGCGSVPRPAVPLVAHVDVERFMGDWYVIACIPTWIERDAWNAVESYRLEPDGTIATTFTFRQGGFAGPEKRYHPRGFIVDRASNAIWGMQFVWPIKADYRIAYLADDYGETIIAREDRDYVWIMARTPTLDEAEYGRLTDRVAAMGYDTAKLRKVPQQWPAPATASGGHP